jgi:hypothetical protein
MDALQAIEANPAPNLSTNATDNSNYLSEAVTLRDLLRDGLTLAEAGRQLGISRSTAFRRLTLIQEDVDRGVVNLLAAKSLDFAQDWITAAQKAAEKGDHRPAMQALQTIKAVEPIADSSRGGSQVNILIGTPDAPIRIQSPQVVDTE